MEHEIKELLELVRSMETDHLPNGWPAVMMSQVSALAYEVERLSEINTKLKAQLAQSEATAERRRQREGSLMRNAFVGGANWAGWPMRGKEVPLSHAAHEYTENQLSRQAWSE